MSASSAWQNLRPLQCRSAVGSCASGDLRSECLLRSLWENLGYKVNVYIDFLFKLPVEASMRFRKQKLLPHATVTLVLLRGLNVETLLKQMQEIADLCLPRHVVRSIPSLQSLDMAVPAKSDETHQAVATQSITRAAETLGARASDARKETAPNKRKKETTTGSTGHPNGSPGKCLLTVRRGVDLGIDIHVLASMPQRTTQVFTSLFQISPSKLRILPGL